MQLAFKERHPSSFRIWQVKADGQIIGEIMEPNFDFFTLGEVRIKQPELLEIHGFIEQLKKQNDGDITKIQGATQNRETTQHQEITQRREAKLTLLKICESS